jgi:hypothetical protein
MNVILQATCSETIQHTLVHAKATKLTRWRRRCQVKKERKEKKQRKQEKMRKRKSRKKMGKEGKEGKDVGVGFRQALSKLAGTAAAIM